MENWSDPLAAWDFTVLAGEITMKEFQDVPYFKFGDEYAYGSYGKNAWVSEPSTAVSGDEAYVKNEYFFQNVRVRHVSRIPLFGDCSFVGGFPDVYDEPEQSREFWPVYSNEINRWNKDRHKLSVNLVFLDWSVRKVGLRQLWSLRWNKQTVDVGGKSINGWGVTTVVPLPKIMTYKVY
jgi:hypothetical protein